PCRLKRFEAPPCFFASSPTAEDAANAEMGACVCVGQARPVERVDPEATSVEEHRRINIKQFYDIGDRIGQGSYGAVYRATQRASGKYCAVKCIKARLRTEARRCSQEVAIMRSVDHPNVVKLLESFQDGRCTYLVVELCRGGHVLSRSMTKGRPFSERKAAVVLQQILRGTLYLHSRSIAHRDLKPDNLLFSSDAPVPDNTVKIIDFGLARQFAAGEVLMTTVGSPAYVAPEVLRGKGYDSQCDIWSLGVTAYLLACGQLPFSGKTQQDVLDRVAEGRPAFRPLHWRRVSARARLFVSGLLCSDPRARPAAAQALADAWLAPEAGEEAAGMPRDLLENLRRFKSQSVVSKAALHIVAGLLDDAEVCALRSAFVALDADGDGRLSPWELREGLRLRGLSVSEQELQEILEGMDVNGNGAVEYTEFLAAAVDRSKYQGEGLCRYAFEVLDWDGDGQISPQDMRRALRHRSLSGALGAEFQATTESLPGDGDCSRRSSMSLSDFTEIMCR
ncbi:unnamed protein product, partial [Prorocentrum cordatum]